MPDAILPMIHVPDVRATAEWYVSIGFKMTGQNVQDGEMNWAKLSFGGSEIMLSICGRPSSEDRREFDLYIQTDRIEEIYNNLKDRVELVEDLHDTFYGMREFIIRDYNRFWISFGQPIPNQ